MPMSLTASDRTALIKLAAGLPKGSDDRKVILAALKTSADRHGTLNVSQWKSADEDEKVRMMSNQVTRAYDILQLVKTLSQVMKHPASREVAGILRPLERLQIDLAA